LRAYASRRKTSDFQHLNRAAACPIDPAAESASQIRTTTRSGPLRERHAQRNDIRRRRRENDAPFRARARAPAVLQGFLRATRADFSSFLYERKREKVRRSSRHGREAEREREREREKEGGKDFGCFISFYINGYPLSPQRTIPPA